jgi:hypothetical protein
VGHRGGHRPPFGTALALGVVAVEHWVAFEARVGDPFALTARQVCNAVHTMLREASQYDPDLDIDAELAALEGDSTDERDAEADMARIISMGGEVLA